jgi:peptidoglycan LD-endopeptidase LytH
MAGVLLLAHTSVQAESYLRVHKQGVVYYYYANREHPQLDRTALPDPVLRRSDFGPQRRPAAPGLGAFFPGANQDDNLRSRLINAVNRMEANLVQPSPSPYGAQNLGDIRLGKTDDLPVADSSDPGACVWTAPGYLGGLLAKFPYRRPHAAVTDNTTSWWAPPQPDPARIRRTRALVREVCRNFFQGTQEQPSGWGPLNLASARDAGSTQLPYCFPVAPPYSFRDTWGDWRSGGRKHHAVDIFAGEGTPVYAMTAGVIHTLASWGDAGITLLLQGQDGKGYGYMHLHGYAPGIVAGKTVQQGELIAYVGRTGVRQDSPHLHLQVYAGHRFSRDELLNPYGFLVQLCNGRGVNDLWDQKIARRLIPAVEVINQETLKLSDAIPGRPPKGQKSVEGGSTKLTKKF